MAGGGSRRIDIAIGGVPTASSSLGQEILAGSTVRFHLQGKTQRVAGSSEFPTVLYPTAATLQGRFSPTAAPQDLKFGIELARWVLSQTLQGYCPTPNIG